MRQTISVLAAMLVLAAGTGCSDDGDPDAAGGSTSPAATTAPDPAESTATRPEPPPDQSRWARQADEACRPWQERIDALDPPANAAELESWLGELVPLVRKQAGALAAVKPPAKQAEAKRAALFVETMTELEQSLTRYRAAIGANDAAAIRNALEAANAAGGAARSYAVSLELTQCGGYSEG